MPKADFQALKLSVKPSKPFPSDLNTVLTEMKVFRVFFFLPPLNYVMHLSAWYDSLGKKTIPSFHLTSPFVQEL